MKFVRIFTVLLLSLAFFASSEGNFCKADNVKFLRYPHVSSKGMIAFSYQGDIWVADKTGKNARRLTNHLANDTHPRFSPDGTQIAFNSNRMGNGDLWVVPVTGGIPRQLTFHSTNDRICYWTPDGKQILFSSSRSAHPFYHPLYLVSVEDDTLPLPVNMGQAATGMVSPDGKAIVYNQSRMSSERKHYRGNAQADVYLHDIQTSKAVQLTDTNAQEYRDHVHDGYPMWGSNGKIYFVSERGGFFNLWRMDTNGKNLAQVTNHNIDGVQNPSISPDGSTIIYENEFELWLYSVASGKTSKLSVDLITEPKHTLHDVLTSKKADGFAPSADGKRVAVDFHGEIFTLPVDPKQGEKGQITRSPWRDRYQLYSPDGKYLVYISDKTHEEEIWLHELSTGIERQLTEHESLKTSLTWSHDSKTLYFVAAKELFSIDIASGTPKKVLEAANGGSGFGGTGAFTITDLSADGQWMVYSRKDIHSYTDVYLLNLTTKEEINLTQSHHSDTGGVLAKDGSSLYFISRRDGKAHLFALPFQKVTEDTNDPLVQKETTKKEKKKSPEEGDKSKTDKKPQVKALEINVDLDNIKRRPVQLTKGETTVGKFFLSKTGSTLYFSGSSDKKNGFYSIKTDGSGQKRISEGNFRSFKLSANKDFIFNQEGDKLVRMSLSGAKKTVPVDLRVAVDVVGEREQIFEEAWRSMKYRFYDENMHGFDWAKIKAYYKPIITHAATNQDVYDLANEMIGELNASHVGVRGSSTPSMKSLYSTRSLGFEMEPDGNRYRVSHIYHKGPADKDWVDLQVGDHVLALNGQDLVAGDNYWKQLNELLNDYVTVTVTRQSEDAPHDIRVKTITSLRTLKYEEWIANNRKKVEELSGGKIAYVHIKGMNRTALEKFRNEVNQFWDAKGLIIDIRYNGGGNTDQELLDIMERKPFSYWNSRYASRADGRRPKQAIAGPQVMMINHRSFSDAEVTPQGFRDLKLGKIVGSPTGGGVIATGSHRLINGGTIRTPGALVVTYDPTKPNNYGINLENYGVPPDVWVENTAQDEIDHNDRELQKAIEEALKMLNQGTWQFSPKKN
ncbi:MAG: DPP IV N-terminal domain-containing protein [Pirellulaceae bacterium]|nr:DPP IV N-terminal domain-containing protein [Pirellulaceae bacterium]